MNQNECLKTISIIMTFEVICEQNKLYQHVQYE